MSRDSGATWSLTPLPLQDGWGLLNGCKIRTSRADASVVRALCGLGTARGFAYRVFVSRDAGESYAKAAGPTTPVVPDAFISGLAAHPTEPGTA